MKKTKSFLFSIDIGLELCHMTHIWILPGNRRYKHASILLFTNMQCWLYVYDWGCIAKINQNNFFIIVYKQEIYGLPAFFFILEFD